MDATNHPKPRQIIRSANQFPGQPNREEGAWKRPRLPLSGGGSKPIVPSRPNAQKIATAIAPIMRHACPSRIKSLDEIARLLGERPQQWKKPKFGDFEYWLGHQCGWITDEELESDTAAYEAKRQRSLQTSHRFATQRFTWMEEPRYKEPKDTGEYVPEISMKLVNDRNLTDSARRIALFVLRHAYQDNRSGRFVGMTVSFIMQGLTLSRRTVQRSLTLLETRGYFRCEVAKGDTTRMCIGLIVHLLGSLLPAHHQQSWPERRRKSEASAMPQKQEQFYKKIYQAKNRVMRITWALKCMNGVARRAFKGDPTYRPSRVKECRGFQNIGAVFLHPLIRTQLQYSQ